MSVQRLWSILMETSASTWQLRMRLWTGSQDRGSSPEATCVLPEKMEEAEQWGESSSLASVLWEFYLTFDLCHTSGWDRWWEEGVLSSHAQDKPPPFSLWW